MLGTTNFIFHNVDNCNIALIKKKNCIFNKFSLLANTFTDTSKPVIVTSSQELWLCQLTKLKIKNYLSKININIILISYIRSQQAAINISIVRCNIHTLYRFMWKLPFHSCSNVLCFTSSSCIHTLYVSAEYTSTQHAYWFSYDMTPRIIPGGSFSEAVKIWWQHNPWSSAAHRAFSNSISSTRGQKAIGLVIQWQSRWMTTAWAKYKELLTFSD